MKTNHSSRFATPTALRRDAHQLTEDAEALLQATRHVVDDKVNAAREQLVNTLDRSREVWNGIEDRAAQGARQADTLVHEHPYPTAAIALGIGAILGILISRRY